MRTSFTSWRRASAFTVGLAATLAASVLAASPASAQHNTVGQWQPHELGQSVPVASTEFLSTRRAVLTPHTAAGAAVCKVGETPQPTRGAGKDGGAPNRLRVGTLMQFDARTRTVGEAMNHLLTPVRYRVTTRTVDSTVSAAVMRRPLPPQARDSGLMTIEQGLLMLVGQEHRIVVDHRARLVAIERVNAQAQTQTQTQ